MNFLNSSLYQFLEKATNLIILNLLILLTSVGIITIFPAIVSGFAVTRGHILNKEHGIVVPFFKNFKNYFIKSNLIGIPIVMIFISLGYYISIFYRINTTVSFFIFLFAIMVLSIYLLFLFHYASIVVHIDCTVKEGLKNAFLLVYFKPLLSIVMLVTFILTVFISLIIPIYFLFGAITLFITAVNFLVIKKTELLPN